MVSSSKSHLILVLGSFILEDLGFPKIENKPLESLESVQKDLCANHRPTGPSPERFTVN